MAKILIAEEDGSMTHFLSIILERAGHEVEHVSTKEKVFEQLEQTSYDVLLTDVEFSSLEGAGMTRKATLRYPNLKTILISGLSAVLMQQLVQKNPQKQILTKPFNVKHLLQEVDIALSLP